MIMDELSEFCDATALSTSGTGLAVVGSTIDLGIADRMLGNSMLYCVIQVTTAVDSSGDGATVQFQICSDAQSPLAADASETLHVQTGAIAQATLVAGYELVIALPVGLDNAYERYLGIQQNVGVEAVTAGAINAFLTMDPYGWKAFPEGNN